MKIFGPRVFGASLGGILAEATGSERHGLDFDLTKEDFTWLVLSPCTYCGSLRIMPRRLRRKPGLVRSILEPYVLVHGIDRAKSSRGYTRKNSLTCCWICNQAKCDMPLAKFEEWICRIYEHRNSWPYLKELHRPSLADIRARVAKKKKNRIRARRFYTEIFRPRLLPRKS